MKVYMLKDDEEKKHFFEKKWNGVVEITAERFAAMKREGAHLLDVALAEQWLAPEGMSAYQHTVLRKFVNSDANFRMKSAQGNRGATHCTTTAKASAPCSLIFSRTSP